MIRTQFRIYIINICINNFFVANFVAIIKSKNIREAAVLCPICRMPMILVIYAKCMSVWLLLNLKLKATTTMLNCKSVFAFRCIKTTLNFFFSCGRTFFSFAVFYASFENTHLHWNAAWAQWDVEKKTQIDLYFGIITNLISSNVFTRVNWINRRRISRCKHFNDFRLINIFHNFTFEVRKISFDFSTGEILSLAISA